MNTHPILQIPDALVTGVVFLSLCLFLTRWLAGLDIGVAKFPEIEPRERRSRVSNIGLVLLLVSTVLFLPIIPESQATSGLAEDPMTDEPPATSRTGTTQHTFAGSLGNYSVELSFAVDKACKLSGQLVVLNGTPSGGKTNPIVGAVMGTEIYFTRQMQGEELGKTDRFEGELSESGRIMQGQWAAYSFQGTGRPAILGC